MHAITVTKTAEGMDSVRIRLLICRDGEASGKN
jgi:hypothetical protein